MGTTVAAVTAAVQRAQGQGLRPDGVMNLIQHKLAQLEIAVSAEQGEISEQEYVDKIQEAFRQLGIDVIEE